CQPPDGPLRSSERAGACRLFHRASVATSGRAAPGGTCMTRLRGVGVLLAMVWACGQQSGAGPASASADPPATGPAADGGTPSPDPLPAGRAVDPYKELAVVDPSVVEDARAASRGDGPWSFRFVIEQLSPQPAQAVEAALARARRPALRRWVQRRAGDADAIIRFRPGAVAGAHQRSPLRPRLGAAAVGPRRRGAASGADAEDAGTVAQRFLATGAVAAR